MSEVLYAYLVRPDALSVWKYDEVKKRLDWYYKVMRGERPAKYRIVKRIPIPNDYGDLTRLSEDILWDIHNELRKEFLNRWSNIKKGVEDLDDYPEVERSFLDLKIEIVDRMISPCRLCEHKCGAMRREGKRGICGLDITVRVATAFLHLGEEAPLVPSGTIFFTGCSFKCVFCQNWDISQNPYNGESVTPEVLARIAVNLASRGARNINYVGGNPDQSMHVIIESLRYMDVNIPLLWNSNMYLTKESMELLLDLIDIWLPDFKYGSDECALRLSRVRNYFEIVSRNHKMAYDFGDNIIIRHLVLPNHLECCTKRVIDWIAENIPNVLVNVMDQYRPEYLVARNPEKFRDINRRLRRNEIEEAYGYAERKKLCFRPIS